MQSAEAGGEAFDLGLDCLLHGALKAIRNVAVTPGGMLALGSPGGVEETWLGDQNEGLIRDLALPWGAFRGGQLFERSAQVNGGGAAAIARFPGDRFGKGPVYFECSRAVLEAAYPPAVTVG